MNDEDPGLDAQFDGLRHAHRSERAPGALRRRALERSSPLRLRRRSTRARAWLARGSLLLGPAAGVAACLWLGVSLFVAHDSIAPAPVPSAELVPNAEPPRPLASRCPSPPPALPWNPAELGLGARAAGFEVEVFESETDCGPLQRRFLVRTPAGDAGSSPVLIVLHDADGTAEAAQRSTSSRFDELARRERVVLVYANGSQNLLSTLSGPINAGVWQTDEGAHPAVDDVDYLRGVVERLRATRHLAGETFLVGHGSGAMMALVAALRQPERYAGVAALLPARLPWKEDLDGGRGAAGWRSHLRSVFIELPEAPATASSALVQQWASALGTEPGAIGVTRGQRFDRVDAPLANGAALRIVRRSGEPVPALTPGAARPLRAEPPQADPFAVDALIAAWNFIHPSPR